MDFPITAVKDSGDGYAPRMCLGPGFGFLPITLGILSVGTFIATYIIAILNGHVVPFFPYISDTGTKVPESCVFGEFLNIAGFLAFFTMYVRYKLVQEFCRDTDSKVCKTNKAALIIGLFCALGMTLVGNFQETNVEPVHILGAALVFAGGCLYSFLHVFISYRMYPTYCGVFVCRWRLGLAIVSVIFMSSAFIAGTVANEQFAGSEKTGSDRLHWGPDDPGFAAHVVSTMSEWIMALAFILFFFTYIRDFQKVGMQVQTRVYVSHLDELPSTNAGEKPDERTPILIT